VSAAEGAITYDQILISDLEIMTQATNYRNWMYRQIAPYVGARILEIGAGIGNFTEFFQDRELVVPSDNFPACIGYLERRFANRANVQPLLFDIAAEHPPELTSNGFDTVVCLNVLEHIEDDERALHRMWNALAPEGRLVLLVPACQFIYGTVDRSLGHYRRYSRRNLVPKMRSAGFHVETCFSMNLLGIAGWFLNNRVLRRRQESRDQVMLFDRLIVPVVERMERVVAPPIGMSLIAIGRKRQSA
jgi:SAM-dependent methyltransferase